MSVFLLLTHLAGAICCGTLHDERGQRVEYATLAECRAAGEAWLAGVRERNPNDHFECVRKP
jgi:hypothetical protein